MVIFDHFEGKIWEKPIFDPTNLHNSMEQVRGRSPDGFEQLYNIFGGSDIDFQVKIVIFDFWRPILDTLWTYPEPPFVGDPRNGQKWEGSKIFVKTSKYIIFDNI